ncbi:metal-dependent transcriptional regulator [Aerococcus sp. 1KP-2016]|uniref:metal-dependent transcriptional regulator n=1 Tax=Aerococcus sp. 1KP-2016 TaxID=1981982 RepID=UPI000B991FDA|nr:metal-dependent transcriptional regulator [Aerococcus sp. 1KP-2016]OYQ68314.1 iron-dependent repressor [Aerococcus sp. 1KP-2016]
MSKSREDYMKVIFEFGGQAERVGNKAISEALNISAASVTEMISKLQDEGWVTYIPYQGVQLTEEGTKMGASLVRRHRIWEMFLYEKLGYDWDQVHEEAEQLEHAGSELFVDSLDAFLGNPTYCPHGGAIPDKDGKAAPEATTPLADLAVGDKFKIKRVTDDRDLLTYLDKLEIKLDKKYTVEEIENFDNSYTIGRKGENVVLNPKATVNVFVEKD